MLTGLCSKRFLLMALAVSGLVHLVIVFISPYLYSFWSKAHEKAPLIEVSLIDPSEVEHLRTAGIANGAKYFSMPAKALAGKKSNTITPKKNIVRPAPKKTDDFSLASFSRILKTTRANEPGPDPRDELRSKFESVNVSAFNIKFEPPEGVNENELNKTEQIFYGFYKRVYESYLSSFVKAWQGFLMTSPIRAQWRNSPQTLIGRIQYDDQGNIDRIQFLKGSDDPHFQELFETTLRGINSLPNPPQLLVKKDGRFTVYYQLFL